ncbi:MAG: hypothetical protein QMD71_09415 [bacterium]|nr:hypothetical protein [bacterium]
MILLFVSVAIPSASKLGTDLVHNVSPKELYLTVKITSALLHPVITMLPLLSTATP